MRNLMLVMFLGGLWHGAGWTFALWGIYHGGLLALHAAWRHWDRWRIPHGAAVTITFVGVLFGWVLFRSENLSMALQVGSALLGLCGVEPFSTVTAAWANWVLLGTILAVIWTAPNVWQLRLPCNLATAALLAGLLVVCILRLDAESPFLYFQF
jgi:alginate O-acetyltransferase complex protein AlgI